MTVDPRYQLRFLVGGTIVPLLKADGRDVGWAPTRPLGGWLIVYGLLGKGGKVTPITDRQDQVFQAASRPDGIDTTEYLTKGYWNDTHRKDPELVIGRPTGLAYHGVTSELAKAHGKVGWWTEGHLIDRHDPRSWDGLPAGKPSAEAFDRADKFWQMARLLKGVPRKLGLSAEGIMALTPDRRNIVWAKLQCAAVCELPINPATTIEPMEMAVTAMCKGAETMQDLAPEDLEGGGKDAGPDPAAEADPEKMDRLVKSIMHRQKVTEAVARRWVIKWLRSVRGAED